MTEPPPDRGLQAERTRLAWQRTTLAGLAAVLVALRLLVAVSPATAAVLGGGAGLALAAIGWSTLQRRTARRVAPPAAEDGQRLLLPAALVVTASLTALAYVLVA